MSMFEKEPPRSLLAASILIITAVGSFSAIQNVKEISSVDKTQLSATTLNADEVFDGYIPGGTPLPEPATRGPAGIFAEWDEDELVTIKEGNHIGNPNIILQQAHWADEGWDYTGWVLEFDESALYDIASNPKGINCSASDQGDWNKLAGHTWYPLQNAQKNTAMLGWRYFDENNDGDRELQITPYYHDDDGDQYHGDFPNDLYPIPVLNVQTNTPYYVVYRLGKEGTKKFQVYITKAYDEDCFGTLLSHTLHPYTQVPELGNAYFDFESFNISRQVNFWFGGQCKAPQDISIHRRILNSSDASYIYEHIITGNPLTHCPNSDSPGPIGNGN